MRSHLAGWKPALFALVALLASTAAIAGCGGDDGAEQEARQAEPELAESINLADCRDWNAGTVEERLGTIHGIQEFLGTQVPGTSGSREDLDDESAYELLDGWCGNEFARGFRLYKLYARAQAFAGAPASGGE
jgi:hypothetical protein